MMAAETLYWDTDGQPLRCAHCDHAGFDVTPTAFINDIPHHEVHACAKCGAVAAEWWLGKFWPV